MEEVPLPISLPQDRLAPAKAVVAACHIPGSSLTASAICHIVPHLLGRQKAKTGRGAIGWEARWLLLGTDEETVWSVY